MRCNSSEASFSPAEYSAVDLAGLPSRTSSSPIPRTRNSSTVRAWMPSARDVRERSDARSTMRTPMPSRDSSRAAVRPVGPAPAIRTGTSCDGFTVGNYVLGDLHLAGDVPEDQLSIFLGRNGFLVVFPMGDGRFRFMATDPDGITGDTGDPTLEDIQRLYDSTVHLPARLYNLNWSSRFRINSRHMTTLR